MQFRKDERMDEAMGDLNVWVQRLNEVYGAWQVGWEGADERILKACGEIAMACQRVQGAMLTLRGESPSLERPTIDLAELEAQVGWTRE